MTPAAWRRMLFAWVVMAVAMTANGIFRIKVLAPRWGDVWAGAASAASGIALIQLIARQAMQFPASPRQRIQIAALWLFLTLTFEFTFGRYADRKSWSELLANYNLAQGRLWPIVLVSLVAAPFFSRRNRVTSATC